MGQFTVGGQMPVFGQLLVVICRGTGRTYLCWENGETETERRELSVFGIEDGTVTFYSF